jgi:CBS domain-containing protein
VKSVREETPIDEVLNVMTSAEIRRVTVVNANNELVGIVSIGDISKHTRQDNQVGKAIEDISQAPPNN